MPRIQAVKNFTANMSGSADAVWKPTTFGFVPDEAIVRSITYSGPDAQLAGSFLVYCSLINDYIGSFQVGTYGITVCPQTLIFMPPTQPMPPSLMFRIDTVDATGNTLPYTGLAGDISISIDFIKYRDH